MSDMRNEEKHANRTKYMDSGHIIAQYVVDVNIFVKLLPGVSFFRNSSCKKEMLCYNMRAKNGGVAQL